MKTNDMPPNLRFQIAYSKEEVRALTVDQKIQHFRDGIFDAIAQTIKEGTIGQPPMVERFRTATSIVDGLLSKGVPFGVSRNSRMNKELRRVLNEQARQSSDTRKSRRKEIGADATRQLLRQIKRMHVLEDHFVKKLKIPPYSD
jgi:hypothetical protein